MSFGGSESGVSPFQTTNPTESTMDNYFTTPAGHSGITFVASTGDAGQPAGYPAYSPNVVAVGGTTLNVSGSNYVSETGWSKSGGGKSLYEAQPTYQKGVVTQSTTRRTTPDVSMDADPNTGVAVYDSWDFPTSPWFQVGGTSLSAPMFAGLVAVADQGRTAAGLTGLDGANDTLPKLYAASALDFNDITSGNNGFAAGAGYDLVTGRGTPIANKLVYDLAGWGTVSGTVFQDNNGNGVNDGSDAPLAAVKVYVDANNNGVLDSGETSMTTAANGAYQSPTIANGHLSDPAGDAGRVVQTAPTGGAGLSVAVSGNVTGKNFGDFSTMITAPGNTDTYYVKLDSTHTYVQISASTTPLSTPTYQIALASLPSLTFSLPGTSNNVYVDFANGSPIPASGIALNAAVGSNGELRILGIGPAQLMTMTDTQIGPSGGPAIAYQNLAQCRSTTARSIIRKSVDTTGPEPEPGSIFNWNG